ncbi:DUF1801 domain-containing protein [Candidatus Villigracilis affinis]|uniref:DUF1801 domain-containing protein n=1 Tax=Candidatus Villigracilis affinis TaxID=3140682 RepID=UPI002A1FC3A5|nr:DUF1801 domain-containing protein [Anaerolineales bacterium]
MKYAKSKNDIVNEYIGDLNDEIAPLFLEIRSCVLAAGPAFNESIKWKNCLVYATTKNHIQTVVGKGKVSLIFFDGISLNDKYGLLEGDGSKARTMRITSLDFNKTALKDYVKQTLKNEK